MITCLKVKNPQSSSQKVWSHGGYPPSISTNKENYMEITSSITARSNALSSDGDAPPGTSFLRASTGAVPSSLPQVALAGGASSNPGPNSGGPIRTPRSQAGQRIRRFVFTLNNYTDEEVEQIKTLSCTWLIFGKEVAPSTGTPHLQGACVIGRQVAFSQVKTWPGFARSNLQVMCGTPQQCRVYCSKEDPDFYETGVIPLDNGKQTTLTAVVARVRAGESLADLARDEEGGVCVVKFSKGLTVLRSCLVPPRTQPPTVIWLHGPTGAGKTREAVNFAEKHFGQFNFWISSGGLRWFDGYDGHKVAIFDDFRPKHVSHFSFLLRLLDRYPVQVEIKGAFIQWVPHYIFITAPGDARETWSYSTPENLAQLERRITHSFEIPREIPKLQGLSLATGAPTVQVPVLPRVLATSGGVLTGIQQARLGIPFSHQSSQVLDEETIVSPIVVIDDEDSTLENI